ncbi:MAG: AI-2E family transporter, partial [Phycisphaerales bacterium]|nr:AI-2E family transporter [Phycisphaerales bacterium]
MTSGDERRDAARSGDWRQTHLWQIQPIRDVLVFAAIFGLLYLGYILSPVTVPMLLAIALAYLFEPVVQRMTRHPKITREGSAMIIIVAAAGLLFLPLVIGGGFAFAQASQFLDEQGTHLRSLAASSDYDPKYAAWGKLARTDDAKAAYQSLPENSIWQDVSDQFVAYNIGTAKTQEVSSALIRAEMQKDASRPGEGDDADSGTATSPDDASRFREVVTRIADERNLDLEWTPGSDEGDANAEPVSILDYERYSSLPDIPERGSALSSVVYIASDWVSANMTRVGTRAVGTGFDAAGAAIRAVTSIGFILFSGFLTAFFFYFFSTGYPKVVTFFQGLLPEKHEATIVDLLGKMDVVISGLIRGRIIIAFILGV